MNTSKHGEGFSSIISSQQMLALVLAFPISVQEFLKMRRNHVGKTLKMLPNYIDNLNFVFEYSFFCFPPFFLNLKWAS